MGRKGGNSKSVLEGGERPRARGGPEPGEPRPKVTPAKGWRGHVGRGWAGARLGGTHMQAP